MKKLVLIGSVVALVLVVAGYQLASSKNPKEEVSKSRFTPGKKASELAQEAIPLEEIKMPVSPAGEVSTAQAQPPASEIPPVVCENQWDKIASVSLVQLKADLRLGAFDFDSNCLKFEKQNPMMQRLYEVCSYSREEGRLQDEEHCFRELPLYRMAWIDRLTADRTDYKNMDVTLLLNKIMSRFSDPQRVQAEGERVLEMARVLAERESGWIEAQKILIGAMLTNFQTKPELLKEIEPVSEAALALDPSNSELVEIRLLASKMNGKENFVHEYVENNPGVAIGYYYRASGALNGGNLEAAVQDLKQAIALSPGEPRFSATLKRIESGETKNVFTSQVNLAFENL